MKTILLLFSLSIVLVASQQQWPPCIDSNYTGTIIPRPDNYSAVCLDVNNQIGVCSYANNGSTSYPERNAGCYDGDTCTDDICTFCDCFYDVNCTFCQVGEWHCGCVFIPKDGCCNYDHQCDTGGNCTTGTCIDHACVITPDPNCCQVDSDCNDDIACTVDTCVQNQCTYVEDNSLCPALVIGDNQCSSSICLIEQQGCVTAILQDGTPCDDGSLCTTNDTCCSGVCKSSGRLSCSDGDLCTRDICDDQVGCIHLCIDPHTISKDLVGNNSFICPCCQDCDCLVPSSIDSFGYYTQPRCVLVELQQPLNLSSTSISFFNHESGTKMRKCMCDPNQGGCIANSIESAKETYPYSGHAACMVNSDLNANNDLPVIFKKRQQLLSTFSPTMLAIQHQNLAVLHDVYKCVLRASAEWTRNISQPGPNQTLVIGPFVYGFNESMCDSTRNDTCLPGFFCALAGQYTGTPFGNVTILFDVCFPLFAIGEMCLGNNTLANNTIYPNVGSGGCSRSQCNGTVCIANPPISCFPNNYTFGNSSFYADCGDGADGVALQCVDNECATCNNNNNNNNPCAIVMVESDNTTSITPLDLKCCSGYACPILGQTSNGFRAGSSFNVRCTACFQQGNRSFEKTHPVCTSDLQCCPPHSYCIDIRPTITSKKRAESSPLANVRGCAACAISSESCDAESSNHTINSTGVCCPGLACQNGKCIKRCTCAAECIDNDPTTMDDCNHEGLCCHTAPAPTPAPIPTPAPTPTPSPSSTIPFRNCVGCQPLGTYLPTVGVFTASIYFEQPLYGESYVVNGGGAGIDVVVINAVNGPSNTTNNNFTFTNTTSIMTYYTNSSLVSQIFLDAQQLYNYLYSCTPVQNEASFDAFMAAGGAGLSAYETIRFQTPQVINSALQYSSFKSPLFDTLRIIFEGDLTINSAAGVLQPNQLADMCHVYWIVYGNLIVNTWMLHGNFIVHGTVTLNAANATLLNNTVGGIVRGRIITTSGGSLVTMSGLWKFDQCNCTECGNRASLVCDPLDPYSCCSEPGLNCITSNQNDTRCCRTLDDFCINNTECCAYTTNPGGSNKCVGGVCQSCVTFEDREKQCDENADCCQPYANSSFICIPIEGQDPAKCCMPASGQCNSTRECCPSTVCFKPLLSLPGTCIPCSATGETCIGNTPCCGINDICKNDVCCRDQGEQCSSSSDCCFTSVCDGGTGLCVIPAQLIAESNTIKCDYAANLTINCCGNGVLDQDEECDLGIAENDNPDSKCSYACRKKNGTPTATIVGSLMAGVLVCCCFALCCWGLCVKVCGIGPGSKSKRSETTSKGRRHSRSSSSSRYSSSSSRNTSRSFSENNNYNPSKSTSYLHYD